MVKLFWGGWGLVAVLSPEALSEGLSLRATHGPPLSYQCRRLFSAREKKLQNKQKILELIARNHNLRRRTPEHRETILKRLREIYGELKRELRLSLVQIEGEEDELIRNGCPGIKL